MRLTAYTDYSLRVLIRLALRPEELLTIAEIARSYGISEQHLMKVVHHGQTGATLPQLLMILILVHARPPPGPCVASATRDCTPTAAISHLHRGYFAM